MAPSLDQTVRLWDVSERDWPHQLGQPLTGHRARRGYQDTCADR